MFSQFEASIAARLFSRAPSAGAHERGFVAACLLLIRERRAAGKRNSRHPTAARADRVKCLVFEGGPPNRAMPGPTQTQKRALFERHFLFGSLEPGEIDALAARARVARYPAGSEIFAKGSPGRSLMAVLAGSVKISTLSLAGKEIAFNVIHAGEIFGEVAVIDAEERTATAEAMSDCELLVLDRREVLALLQKHPEISLLFLRVLCQRLRQTSKQVEDVLFGTLASRLAKALLQLQEDGQAETHGSSAGFRLSQRQLGNIVGGSRESVNRQLQLWHKAGLIELQRGRVAIRDRTAIKRLV